MESITLDREVLHFKEDLMNRYSRLIYNGYFSPERISIQTMIDKSQAKVTGSVRVRLFKGNVIIEGRKSPIRFIPRTYQHLKMTSEYNQRDAEGFIKINASD